MSYRAEKKGIAAEAQQKVLSKWDNDLAVQAMTWVSKNTGISLPDGYDGKIDDTHLWLKDGYILALLANWAKPGSVKEGLIKKRTTITFKQMELIGVFLDVLKKNKLVHDTELFQTVDLYESTNMPMVVFTIGALGRTMQKEGRGFGVAESVGQKKEWTDEQLKAGQNIIGLQMGTNQGASQAGLNMGKSRSIVD